MTKKEKKIKQPVNSEVRKAIQKRYYNSLTEEVAPISAAQFKVLRTLSAQTWGTRNWRSVKSFCQTYDYQEKTIEALVSKKLAKFKYPNLYKNSDFSRQWKNKEVMITNLGQQITEYMAAVEKIRIGISIRKLK